MSLNSYKQNSFLSEARVLLIDPDRANRSILSGMIEDLKPEHFMIAKSVGEGRQAMTSRVDMFDIILLAVKNPPLSGFHFLQEIRGGGIKRVPRDTRTVLISQPPNRMMIELAGSLDADGFLALPLSPAKVIGTLEKVLKREREVKPSEDYIAVKLPRPVAKKPQKEANPKAWVIWNQKEQEKLDLIKALAEAASAVKEEEKVQPAVIENVRTFWLKDLHPGMILAEDIKGEEDELLLAMGTPLNEGLIDKIKKFSEIGLCRSFLNAGAAPQS